MLGSIMDFTEEFETALSENAFGFLNNCSGVFNEVFETTLCTKVGNSEFPIAHFPLDDAIMSKDIVYEGDCDIFSEEESENVLLVLRRKMKYIAQAHSMIQEVAKVKCIVDGKTHVPNNSLPTIDWYKEFGVERKSVRVKDINSIDVYDQDAGYIAITSVDAYKALCEIYKDVKEDSHLSSSPYRSFKYKNVIFVELRGVISGKPLIEKNAYLFPIHSGVASVRYAPANNFMDACRTAKKGYFKKFEHKEDGVIELHSEQNFICVLEKPELVVELIV